MLKSALEALDKRIKKEILYWKMVKNDKFKKKNLGTIP